MKKKYFGALLVCILACITINVQAQIAPVTSLSENFDVACVTTPYHPANWIYYNTVPGTDPMGAWTCNPYDGNYGTPGMMCTGVYGTPNTYHLDTSYLITPLLMLPSSLYPGNVYIKFDSKTDRINLEAKLTLAYTTDTIDASTPYTVLGVTPIFSNPDSSGWVTHEADITSLKGSKPFYIAFRYTSSTTTGSIWYLDNVNVTTISVLGVAQNKNELLPLTVIGNSTRDEITIAYNANVAGRYSIAIYDMVGRQVHDEIINAQAGTAQYKISGLNLGSGMYCIKMGNENTYGITKAIIW